MIRPSSLAATLDVINEAVFYGRPMSRIQREEAARWLAARQLRSGEGSGAFASTDDDRRDGVRLFTGERLRTKLATRRILGQEAARALLLLDASSDEVKGVLERANRWMRDSCYAAHFCVAGECAHAAVGFMRYLAVGGLEDAKARLDEHVEVLSRHRDGNGRWKRFPFYYTLLALCETDLPAAVDELRYAAPACERLLNRSSGNGAVSQRRREIVHRSLAAC